MVAMTVLSLLRIPLTAFAFVSGAIAIGVGFGAQNIINNFISSWILMTERPVRIGDFIEIDDSKGIVEEIGNRSTRIRRTDGVHLLVPNSQMLERKVTNWTLIDRDIRSTVRVGVAYGSPARKVEALIRQAVEADPEIKTEPAPVVIFEDFGDSALIFDVYFWAELTSERDQRLIRSGLRFRIDELFRENGIVIAFPQRDVHLGGQSPLEVRVLDNEK
jgi:small-conductance mechanosensitive channel